MMDIEHTEKRKFEEEANGESGADFEAPDKKKLTAVTADENDISISVVINGKASKLDAIFSELGDGISQLTKRSGCTIDLDHRSTVGNDPDATTRKLILTGSSLVLSSALSVFNELVSRASDPIVSSESKSFTKSISENIETKVEKSEAAPVSKGPLMIPHKLVGSVIGFKGVTITEILKRTGCRVHIVQEGVGEGKDREAELTGTPSQCEEARKIIEGIMEHGPLFLGKGFAPSNIIKEEIEVSQTKVGSLIGSKGAVISDIMLRSGCKIQIDQTVQPNLIKISADSTEHLKLAKSLIEEVLMSGTGALSKDSGVHVSQEMNIFDYQLRRLLADSGDVLNNLQKDCSIKIKIDMNQGICSDGIPVHKVGVLGELRKVQMATKGILALFGSTVDTYKPPVSYDPVFAADFALIHDKPAPAVAPTPAAQMNFGNPLFDMSGGYGNQMLGFNKGAPGVMPNQFATQLPTQLPTAPTPGIYGLGADGTTGVMHKPVNVQDGYQYQHAEIKSEQMGKVIGAKGSNLMLIRTKSGAIIQMIKEKPLTQGYHLIGIVGSPASLTLVGQILQELLVNGPNQVSAMPDATASISHSAANAIINHQISLIPTPVAPVASVAPQLNPWNNPLQQPQAQAYSAANNNIAGGMLGQQQQYLQQLQQQQLQLQQQQQLAMMSLYGNRNTGK